MMRIPKVVHLPWYPVKVRFVTRAEQGVICPPDPGEPIDDGIWNRSKREITLCDDLTLPQLRYTLYHEIIHAVNDAMDTFLDCYTMSERRLTRGSTPSHSASARAPESSAPTDPAT